jgi:S1-C subfamily serine protease
MVGRWLKEILFVFGFVVFLWFMVPEDNLPAPVRRMPAPPPEVVLAKPPPNPRAAPVPIPGPPPAPTVVRRLPPPSANDPVIDIAATPARSSDAIGTAFVLDRGVWGTARHVTLDCARVYVHLGGRWTAASEVRMHRAADVAVLRTDKSGGPALVASDRPLHLQQDGFHVGYPKGQPASIHSRLIGRTMIRWPGSDQTEPTLTWAEVARERDFEGDLGGISGGPVVDAEGRLIGVTIASSVRRKRITTSLVESLSQVAPAMPRGGPAAKMEVASFAETAARLRGADTVTMAYCQFDAAKPAPRRIRPTG